MEGGDRPTFAGNLYADLSETALYYIGGIIKHAKAINAFTNPTTNSYKRLIPGFEAPVLLAYSARNRSASCRIPIVSSPRPSASRVRFPDPACNPYLGFAAMLMAGTTASRTTIHPGDPMDKNLYDLPPEELKDVPTVCGSLREAVEHLRADHAFLTKGDVFTRDQIEAYIELKWEEIYAFEHTPGPTQLKAKGDPPQSRAFASASSFPVPPRRRGPPRRGPRCPPTPLLDPAARTVEFENRSVQDGLRCHRIPTKTATARRTTAIGRLAPINNAAMLPDGTSCASPTTKNCNNAPERTASIAAVLFLMAVIPTQKY